MFYDKLTGGNEEEIKQLTIAFTYFLRQHYLYQVPLLLNSEGLFSDFKSQLF